eukprot:gb/GECG01010584.1/.p1 GENE.gb/GECG01010584.1/~~gb/GECG01010584.1/.p1  ORF type:complete len:133 (+),score=5.84 gb/GECG01010584.1/:1-399(+)
MTNSSFSVKSLTPFAHVRISSPSGFKILQLSMVSKSWLLKEISRENWYVSGKLSPATGRKSLNTNIQRMRRIVQNGTCNPRILRVRFIVSVVQFLNICLRRSATLSVFFVLFLVVGYFHGITCFFATAGSVP